MIDQAGYSVNPPPPPNMHIDAVVPEDAGSKRKIIIMALVTFLIAVLLVMVFTNKKDNTGKSPASFDGPAQPTLTPTLIPYPTLGSMSIYHEGQGSKFSINEPVKLSVKASSQNKNIVGFDVIVTYDKDAFTFVGAQSKNKSFNIFTYDRSTHLSVSGIKALQENSDTAWTEQPLLDMTFQPKKAGTYNFQLSPVGKEASKLVDSESMVVYPQTDELQLEIY